MAARVLVTGAGGPAGRSLSVQLLARGFEVVAVDMAAEASIGLTVAQIPAATDPNFRCELFDIAQRERVDLIVPTVTEELVELVVDDAASDIGAPSVVVGSQRGVAVANDKWLTCLHLDAAGIAVPRFALPFELPTTADIVRRLGLPYLSKPRVGRGSREVAVHADEVVTPMRRFDDSTIVQEFVSGTEYAPNLYLARDPSDDVVIVLEKAALSHEKVGNAVGVRRVVAQDVARLARTAARSLGLTGPVDVDVRRRKDGTPVVLEINARFGANSAHAPEVIDALLAEHLGHVAVAA